MYCQIEQDTRELMARGNVAKIIIMRVFCGNGFSMVHAEKRARLTQPYTANPAQMNSNYVPKEVHSI